MSRLAHYCTKCDHEDVRHDGRPTWTRCPCCRKGDREQVSPEPTVIETFAHLGNVVETEMHQPGTRLNAGTAHWQDLCNCERCQQVYAEASAS